MHNMCACCVFQWHLQVKWFGYKLSADCWQSFQAFVWGDQWSNQSSRAPLFSFLCKTFLSIFFRGFDTSLVVFVQWSDCMAYTVTFSGEHAIIFWFAILHFLLPAYVIAGVHNLRPAGRMRPATGLCAALRRIRMLPISAAPQGTVNIILNSGVLVMSATEISISIQHHAESACSSSWPVGRQQVKVQPGGGVGWKMDGAGSVCERPPARVFHAHMC